MKQTPRKEGGGTLSENGSVLLCPLEVKPMADEDDQIAALQSKLDAQQALLRDWRTRELAEGNRPPEELLADARRRRDAARKAVQALQSKHHALQAERREKSTKLDKLLAKQKSAAKIANPELALPSLALRGGGDDAVREIKHS